MTAALKLLPASTSFDALCTHGLIRIGLGYYEEAIAVFGDARSTLLELGGEGVDHQAVDEGVARAQAALEICQSGDYYSILG